MGDIVTGVKRRILSWLYKSLYADVIYMMLIELQFSAPTSQVLNNQSLLCMFCVFH